MPKTGNPFFDFDVTKVMGDVSLPGFDVEAFITAQQKNFQAFSSAHQLAFEGLQAVAKRQSEILQSSVEQFGKAGQQMMGAKGPEDAFAMQAEFTKDAYETTLANVRELTEMVTKSNSEAFDVINQRVAAGLDEIRVSVKKPNGKAAK